MIKVDRSLVAEPAVLRDDNSNVNGERNRAIAYFEAGGSGPVTFSIYSHDTVRDALKKLFIGKCAYCESELSSTTFAHIEHWRPKGAVIEEPTHKGYYWLASDWRNLLWACPVCNSRRFKGNKFPLKQGSSYALKSTDDMLLEQPLLINPCEDDPEPHFIYNDYGAVIGTTAEGKCSISTYGLDRADLTLARRSHARSVNLALNCIENAVYEAADKLLRGENVDRQKRLAEESILMLRIFVTPCHEFCGLTRYLIKQFRAQQLNNEAILKLTECLAVL